MIHGNLNLPKSKGTEDAVRWLTCDSSMALHSFCSADTVKALPSVGSKLVVTSSAQQPLQVSWQEEGSSSVRGVSQHHGCKGVEHTTSRWKGVALVPFSPWSGGLVSC